MTSTTSTFYKKKRFNSNLMLAVIITLVFLFFYNRYKSTKQREGLAVIDDIKDAITKVTKVADVAAQIPNQITSIKTDIVDSTNVVKDSVNQIDNKLEDFLEKVKQTTIDIVTQKITSVLSQIGDIFKTALINPIVTLFTGIGGIFVGIFGILREIGNKIASLPSCIPTYGITSVYNTVHSGYTFIIPTFLKTIIGKIYDTLFKRVVDWALGVSGYTASYNKCYGFDVSGAIDKIEDSAKKIETSFTSDFGRLDFSKIKV